ncbi:hypothetical protein TPHA_0D02410 [Tetrapisispora phaffii CBS 4417]|uniref:DNA repair protein RAD33 n=1 Tax=Tetrapisispora phaffii (strain ATCC 24235 / CBS 4417 / NBRC 1672 / NRRL Y-8282 / UCD 70-5) TaxID=1071381 RepID=G8BSQ7_TETPH|nr:hypothetical protein TPHA_0D02410 [Tetrapisispora phaffii CBS 4417]CCE62878.1 hypothetical protein TPHA_0D02410 [Tetrapisispora phaffii CBS 4417]
MAKLSYKQVEKFMNAKIPDEIEDSILETFAKYSIEEDMTVANLKDYFNNLELPEILWSKIPSDEFCIEGTSIIDFDLLMKKTYHILIFMDNEDIIDELWGLFVKQSGRGAQFTNVKLKNHVFGVKDIMKVCNTVAMKQNDRIIEMVSVATSGRRLYITYIDFAYIMGKLGLLRF